MGAVHRCVLLFFVVFVSQAWCNLTNSEALRILRNNGMTWSASGNCNNRNNRHCTSFTGMRRATLNGLVPFKRRLPRGCSINVTGGMEIYGHTPTAEIGSMSEVLLNYIQANFRRDRNRGSFRQWRDSSGNSYVLEDTRYHWDITYF